MSIVADLTLDVAPAQRVLMNYDRQVRKRLIEVLDAFALLIMREMQIRSPVDTGFMRSSITITSEGDWVRVIGPTADYSIFVEMGTRFTPAQPFVGPATLAYKSQFERAVREALRP